MYVSIVLVLEIHHKLQVTLYPCSCTYDVLGIIEPKPEIMCNITRRYTCVTRSTSFCLNIEQYPFLFLLFVLSQCIQQVTGYTQRNIESTIEAFSTAMRLHSHHNRFDDRLLFVSCHITKNNVRLRNPSWTPGKAGPRGLPGCRENDHFEAIFRFLFRV